MFLAPHQSSSSSSSSSTTVMNDYVAGNVIKLTLLLVCSMAAVLLNGVVAYCLCRKYRFRSNPGNQYLFSLTLSNLICSLIVAPMTIAGGSARNGGATCQLAAFVRLLVDIADNFTLALIAYDRYMVIVRPMHNNGGVSKGAVILISSWLLSAAAVAPLLTGWPVVAYQPAMFVCVIAWQRQPAYAFALLLCVVLAPACLMFICYTRIYMTAAYQMRKCSSAAAADDISLDWPSGGGGGGGGGGSGGKRHAQLWITAAHNGPNKARRTLLLLLSSYALCWGAAAVWAACEIGGRPTPTLAFVCYFLKSASAVGNAVVYGLMNRSIRQRVRRLFCNVGVGRRGTGGRKRRKRAKAISLHDVPLSRSSSPTVTTNFEFPSRSAKPDNPVVSPSN